MFKSIDNKWPSHSVDQSALKDQNCNIVRMRFNKATVDYWSGGEGMLKRPQ